MSIDITQFHQTFFEESFEGLDVMESGLLELDIGAVDSDVINAIFRAAHSIKGGSATFGFTNIATFTHAMETLLDEIRDGNRAVSTEIVDILLQSVDCLRDMIIAQRDGEENDQERIDQLQKELDTLLGKEPDKDVPKQHTEDETGAEEALPGEWIISFTPQPHLLKTGNDPALLFRELQSLGDLEIEADAGKLPPLAEMDPESCYLSWKLRLRGDAITEEAIREIFSWVEDDCDLEIRNLSGEAGSGEKRDTEKTEDRSGEKAAAPKKTGKKPLTPESSSIRVSIDKVDTLINMVGELVITQSMMGNLDGDFEDFDHARLEQLREGLSLLERNIRELQESVMRIRMLPISFVFSRFPRMVHDLSQKLGKQINFEMSGEQTELDKTVMEKIGDPLVHLVRNSIDHGIEPPEVRRQRGKPEMGSVRLNAFHKGGNIVIEISDDGAGLNKERILEKAREKGLIEEDCQPSEEKIYELLFQPGFSTAETVSDISGRGVGMDVVRRNIRELGGNIDVTSSEGQGTTFTIRLPLTLAILDGQLVRIGRETYIIPLISIIESLLIVPGNINSIASKSEVYKLRDEYIPIIRTHELFGTRADSDNIEEGLLVVIEGDGQKAGLYVDELLGQQQVVIKSLETNYQKVEGISGATILGDGTVALILDVEGLIGMSRRPRGNKPRHEERAVA